MTKLFIITFLLFATGTPANVHTLFNSSEHVMAGDEITLFLNKDGTGVKGAPLHLPNGLAMTFGDIIAMGDYYGVIGAPISSGQTPEDRRVRFIAAFNALARSNPDTAETGRIVAAIHTERETILNGMASGRSPQDIFAQIKDEQNKLYNCLTGGACSGVAWFLTPGRYLDLAKQDYDHFGDHALQSYLAGHEVALHEALEAAKTKNYVRLEEAYAMDAFACHFLTDRYSAGHIRIPRFELAEHVTPGVLGSLLVSFMHDEESAYGLHVQNRAGKQWIAYGDGHYLDPRNTENLSITRQAVQQSANEIAAAFSNDTAQIRFTQLDLIPEPLDAALKPKLDISPMFYWDAVNQQVLRRSDLGNPNDANWTSYWWGWSTLTELKVIHGLAK